MVIFENIDIDIAILENIDKDNPENIDIDNDILKDINIDRNILENMKDIFGKKSIFFMIFGEISILIVNILAF